MHQKGKVKDYQGRKKEETHFQWKGQGQGLSREKGRGKLISNEKGKVKDYQGRKEEGNSFPMKRTSQNPLTWNPKDWEHVEIMSFIKAKCDEYFANRDFVDPWNQFETTTIKWHKIAKVVMQFISHLQWACV